jgi:hypothetical protein
MKQSAVLMLIVLVGLAGLGPAMAAETEIQAKPWEKFNVNAGGFITGINSDVQLGFEGVGVKVDVEEALGLDTNTNVIRIDSFWRFTKSRRHRADFSWFSLRRDGERTLLEDLEIGDTVFPTGTRVATDFDLDVFKGSYSYSFFQDDRVDLAASAGLFVMPISFGIEAEGLVQLQEGESITAPLPVLGLRADFAITPKWFLKSRLEAFYLEINDFKGYILDTGLNLEYNAFKYVGFGAGLNSFNASIEARGETVPGVDLKGTIDYQYFGALVYVKFYLP